MAAHHLWPPTPSGVAWCIALSLPVTAAVAGVVCTGLHGWKRREIRSTPSGPRTCRPIAKLDRYAKVSCRLMCKTEHGKHAPRVRLLASRLPVVSIGLQNCFKPLLGHIGPRKANICRNHLPRRWRQVIEEEVRNDPKGSSPPAPRHARKRSGSCLWSTLRTLSRQSQQSEYRLLRPSHSSILVAETTNHIRRH